MAQIILKRGKAKPFFQGEPIIFSGAIQKTVGNPLPADLVDVYSADKKLIGVGVFNPHSNYRVRLLTLATEHISTQLPELITHRLQQAIARREALNLPNEHTNTYRLFNSEADGLSGLTIDIFADYTVISVTAYWLMFYKAVVMECLKNLNFNNILWREQSKSLAQDGWHKPAEFEKCSTIVTVKENDILYQVDVDLGQKTGFYCDQRDNRLLVRNFAQNRTVLDCYCYSGGFALNASIGGAKKVVGVDSSSSAIQLANENAKLNHLSNIKFETAKAENYLTTAENFDFIILDPPKLAPTPKSLPRAKQAYLKLNRLAMSILPKGGLLLSCSCSNAVSEADFLTMLKLAAAKTGKEISILKISPAAPDHPFLPKSQYGNYLKAILLQIT